MSRGALQGRAQPHCRLLPGCPRLQGVWVRHALVPSLSALPGMQAQLEAGCRVRCAATNACMPLLRVLWGALCSAQVPGRRAAPAAAAYTSPRRTQVADVGCGCGEALLTLAEAFPASTFHGGRAWGGSGGPQDHPVTLPSGRRLNGCRCPSCPAGFDISEDALRWVACVCVRVVGRERQGRGAAGPLPCMQRRCYQRHHPRAATGAARGAPRPSAAAWPTFLSSTLALTRSACRSKARTR